MYMYRTVRYISLFTKVYIGNDVHVLSIPLQVYWDVTVTAIDDDDDDDRDDTTRMKIGILQYPRAYSGISESTKYGQDN